MGRILTWLLALVGLLALVAIAGYLTLRRPDIPYETLAARYESAASRYAELPGGVRMHYRDEGNPEGPVLVLVHGFSASLHTWGQWVERLGDAYRVISLDLPGHGLTRAPAGYAPSMEAFRDEVAAFAAAQNLERFTIAGNSMGGNVAWEFALAHPERVEGLILVDSSGWEETREGLDEDPPIFGLLRNPVLGPIMRDLDNSSLARQGLEHSFADPALVDDAMLSRYVELARAPGHRDILLDLTLDFRSRNYATPERLSGLSMPVLILHGEQDRLVAPADSQKFKDAIPHAELVTFPNVGHIPQEEAPDASAIAVREFLYRVHEGPALATAQ